MIRASAKQLEFLNDRYNDVKEDISIGTDYVGEGLEIIDFEVDDKGRTTMLVEEWYLNNNYAMRCRHQERHPRLKPTEIDYLLGKVDILND